MTTHRRAWIQRAGVVVALAASALLAPLAQPAMAAPTISNVSASPSRVEFNGNTTVRYTLKFVGGGLGEPEPANITVSSNNAKLTCVDGCSRENVDADGEQTATFRYTTAASSNETATITIAATGGQGSDQQVTTRVTLVARAQPAQPQVQTVTEISGKVTDESTGAAISGATVGLLDSQGRAYNTTSNDSGNYRFTGSASNPIAPGEIQLGAKKGDVDKTLTINGSNGQRITNQRIVLALPVEASPTPEPTPDASDEALPEETGDATDPPAAIGGNASSESGAGFGSWLLILVGGLLVALGVGAIVLLWMRRKENQEEEGAEERTAGGRPRPAAPATAGGYGADDATRIAGPPGADTTMVHSPGLADAPTLMHNRPLVDDEFPDPYGAPLPPTQPAGQQVPGYGAPGQPGGWDGNGYDRGGPPTQAGYGATPAGGYGNAPASGGGYGASADGGYGGPRERGEGYGGRGGTDGPATGAMGAAPAGGYGERYDEPTGRYNGRGTGGEYPPPADPYQSDTYGQSPERGRGPEQPERPYGQEPRYEQGEPGYGQRPGYGHGEPGYGQGGYDEPGTGGYESRRGYDGPGGGYGAASSAGGYDNAPASTDGYGGAPPSGDGYGAGQRGYGTGPQGYGGGSDNGGGYGRSDYVPPTSGGYGQAGGAGGYEPRQGYDDQAGGYDRGPEESRPEGYDARGGYGGPPQGGYYGDPAQGGQPRSGQQPPQQPSRSERRSLDWLDD